MKIALGHILKHTQWHTWVHHFFHTFSFWKILLESHTLYNYHIFYHISDKIYQSDSSMRNNTQVSPKIHQLDPLYNIMAHSLSITNIWPTWPLAHLAFSNIFHINTTIHKIISTLSINNRVTIGHIKHRIKIFTASQ